MHKRTIPNTIFPHNVSAPFMKVSGAMIEAIDYSLKKGSN